MIYRYTRTSDEVLSVLINAKVQEKDLTSVTQVLSFPETSELDENLVLLELDNSLLDLVNQGERYDELDLFAVSFVHLIYHITTFM